MDFVTIVPAELWLLLFSYLYLPDLVSVSAACRYFQALAANSLDKHRFHRLGHDYHYEPAYWYLHLLTLLRKPAAASYVEHLTVEHTDSREEETKPWPVLPLAPAVETEDWLLAGDEGAMHLTLPTHCWGGLKFTHLMPIVARIVEAAAAADPDAETTLPLSKLEHYEGHIFNGRYGVDFESIASLMALPRGFDWPASLPKSRAIVGLAQNIRGPLFQYPTEWNETPEDVDWDVLEIPFEGACREEWTIKFGEEENDDNDAP
ncbi:hypothetical protein C8J57DRAFT_1384828 [Mycena rebaudengoi]|nr:hypothetical protein C8J57DRAFT_1384828 [Mycena rebaudengoi]